MNLIENIKAYFHHQIFDYTVCIVKQLKNHGYSE